MNPTIDFWLNFTQVQFEKRPKSSFWQHLLTCPVSKYLLTYVFSQEIATFLYNFGWFSLEFHSRLLIGSFWGIEHLPKLKIAKISFFLISERHAIVMILLIGLTGQLDLLDSWIGQFWSDFHDLCSIGKLLKK